MYIKYFDRIDVSEGIDFNKTCASRNTKIRQTNVVFFVLLLLCNTYTHWFLFHIYIYIYIYIYICVYNSSMFKE